jgi:hypothetical protein
VEKPQGGYLQTIAEYYLKKHERLPAIQMHYANAPAAIAARFNAIIKYE